MPLRPVAIKNRRTLGAPTAAELRKKEVPKASLPLPPSSAPRGLLRPEQLTQIQDRLGTTFRDLRLLEQAFVHRSFVNETYRKNVEHNERLEFLGDKVLGMVLGMYLYQRLPDAPEGELTQIDGALKSNQMLNRVAEELHITEFILMSKGQRIDFDRNDRSRPYMVACVFEALIGALYLDRGSGIVEIFLDTFLFPKIEEVILGDQIISAKSQFQEISQAKLNITPHYQVLFAVGPEHNKVWTMGVFLGERCVGRGDWTSKSGAESAAARDALEKEFGIKLPDNPLIP